LSILFVSMMHGHTNIKSATSVSLPTGYCSLGGKIAIIIDRKYFKYTAWTKWRVLVLHKMVRIITTVLRLWQKYVALCSQQGKLTSKIQTHVILVMGGSVHGEVQCSAYRRMSLNKEAWLHGWRRGVHKSLWQIPRSWIVVGRHENSLPSGKCHCCTKWTMIVQTSLSYQSLYCPTNALKYVKRSLC
jgi:hypothetical protein